MPGSSPRLWGTPGYTPQINATVRFIPTAVGNAYPITSSKIPEAVHPHGCGERGYGMNIVYFSDGSSPRLWGTRPARADGKPTQRFIPTAVGNATTNPTYKPFMAVHPHGCGERDPVNHFANGRAGSSPRLWGTHISRPRTVFDVRFIPTAVGNAGWRSCSTRQSTVHPHGCGERLSRPNI